MLETLDQIPWAQLTHAYGSASDVPDQIRALASPDEAVRRAAFRKLFANIWHQGTVCEATSFAAPFFLGLLRAPEIADKDHLLYLLGAIATGNSYHNQHRRHFAKNGQNETEEFKAKIDLELSWVRAAHEAVADGTDLFLSLLSDPAPSVRIMVPHTLSFFPERAEETIPALVRQFETEHHPEVRASILLGIASLLTKTGVNAGSTITWNDSPRRLFIDSLRSAGAHSLVRVVAALGVVESRTLELVDEALAVFSANIGGAMEALRRNPWANGDLRIREMTRLLSDQPERALKWLQDLLQNPNPQIRCSAIYALADFRRQHPDATPAVVPHVAPLLADADPTVRARAGGTLEELKGAGIDVKAAVEPFREHSDEAVRLLAERILAPKMKAPGVRQPGIRNGIGRWLTQLNQDGSDAQRLEAARAIDELGAAAWPLSPTLEKRLSDPLPAIRVHVARALWHIWRSGERILPSLIEAVAQPSSATVPAIQCLGEMGALGQSAIPHLRALLDAPGPIARAVQSGAEPESDEAIRAAARVALREIESHLPEKVRERYARGRDV